MVTPNPKSVRYWRHHDHLWIEYLLYLRIGLPIHRCDQSKWKQDSHYSDQRLLTGCQFSYRRRAHSSYYYSNRNDTKRHYLLLTLCRSFSVDDNATWTWTQRNHRARSAGHTLWNQYNRQGYVRKEHWWYCHSTDLRSSRPYGLRRNTCNGKVWLYRSGLVSRSYRSDAAPGSERTHRSRLRSNLLSARVSSNRFIHWCK